MTKILQRAARFISIIFHPLLIPTIGFIILSYSGFYFSILPWSVKRIMLLIVFLSTCVLPALSIGLLVMNPKFDRQMSKSTDRIVPILISSVFYYMGYLLLERLPVFPIYNLFLMASVLVQLMLVFVSFFWKISAHSTAIGGLIGGVIGLSLRFYTNPVALICMLMVVAGLVASSRLILLKHTQLQVFAGFFLGFLIMMVVIVLI